LAQDTLLRQYIGAVQVYPSFILQQISLTHYENKQFAACCLFVRTLPTEFALLGWKWKYKNRRRQQHYLRVLWARALLFISVSGMFLGDIVTPYPQLE
jgi:hypothetical protein